MRLPDFSQNEALIRLKRQMGLRSDEYGSFTVTITPGGLTVEELDKLTTVGIDVGWDDLTVLDNGTIVYKGCRVLLYIRDVHEFAGRSSGPRYHLATCSTIKQQDDNGRIGRYVVAAKPDKIFDVNLISNTGANAKRMPLRVCKNCLRHLSFNGFSQMSPSTRERFVNDFTPDQFFALYPQSLHTRLPSHQSDNAPVNDYTADFQQISRSLRESTGWQCATCKEVLSVLALRKYLQTHHVDGDRRNNNPNNLKVVCIGCHAMEPYHSHMQGLPDYKEYRRLRHGWAPR